MLYALNELGLSIERGDNKKILRRQHEKLHTAMKEFIVHIQDFKMDTICQIHTQNKASVAPNDWFVTPFDAYIRS